MPIDWSLARPVDIAGNALQGYAAGREMRRQNLRENALRQYASGDSEGGLNALLAVDPGTALTLRRVNEESKTAMRTEDRATADRHRAAAGRFFMALRAVPADQRAARAQQMVDQNFGQWEPEDQERIRSSLPQANWSDEGLDAMIAHSMDPEASARLNLQRDELNLRRKDTFNDNDREDRRLGLMDRSQRLQDDRENRRLDYEGQRIGLDRQRVGYEGRRIANDERRLSLEDQRILAQIEHQAQDPSSVFGRILDRAARGEQLTPGEQRAVDLYQSVHRNPDPMGLGGAGGGVLGSGPDEYNSASSGSPEPGRVVAPANNLRRPVAPPARTAPPADGNGPVVRRERVVGRVRLRPDARGVYAPRTAADMQDVPVGGRFINPADGRVLTRSR